MKLKDVLRLSTRILRTHLKRNLLVISAMSIIFGLIFAINLWLQGVEDSYFALASRATNGQVIISASSNPESLSPGITSPATRDDMVADIESHGGRVLADADRFGIFDSVILPADLVQNNIEIDPAQAPADAAPVLASTFLGEQLLGRQFASDTTPTLKDYETFRKDLIGQTFTDAYGAKYYVVGLAPGNFHIASLSFKQLDRTNGNLLNPLLNYISTPGGAPIAIDDGRRDLWQSGDNPLDAVYADSVVAIFDDPDLAYDYFRHSQARFPNVDFPNRTYSASLIAGPSPETQYIFGIINLVAVIISSVLGLVAAIIVIFTIIRLLDQDRQNIALYYSLGATPGQVCAIYLCYFLELMIGAAIFAFVLASALVLLFSFLNQDLLSLQAMLSFGLASAPQVVWYGLSPVNSIVVGAVILLTLPVICATIERYARQNT